MSFYEDASWLLIPSGIEEDIVFAQKPTSGLGDLTFTRSSDATYTDASGVVRRSPYNLLQYSNTFSNAVWQLSGTPTLTANYDTNPLTGANDAWRFQSSGSSQRIYQAFSGSFSTFYLYAKGTGTIRLRDSTGTYGFNMVLTSSWQRASLYIPASFSNVQITSDSGCDATIYAAQLVEGTEALDYFPTTNRQDVPRIDFRNADGTLSSCGRLLLEPQRTNSIRNSSMVGAVAPSTLPNNWARQNISGLTQTIVGTGIENGLPYIDINLSGTATFANDAYTYDNSISASISQTWTNSWYFKLITGSPNAVRLLMQEFNSGNLLNSVTQDITPTTNLTRYTQTKTLVGTGVNNVRAMILINFVVGQTYNTTIRIAAPQMELGAYATTWVPTTTAAVTRLADTASKTGVSSLIGQTEGTLFLDFESGVNDSLDYVFGINNGTTNSRIIIYRSSNNTIIMQVRVAGGSQALIQTATVTPNTRQKCAVAYKLNDIAFYVNGAQIGIDTLATIPACSIIATNDGAGAGLFGRPINQAALFTTRLSNATLAQMTTL